MSVPLSCFPCEPIQKRIMMLAFKPSACAVCDVKEPENILLTCYECGISVHNGKSLTSFYNIHGMVLIAFKDCYGSSSTTKEGWICDVCSNKRTLSASYVSDRRWSDLLHCLLTYADL